MKALFRKMEYALVLSWISFLSSPLPAFAQRGGFRHDSIGNMAKDVARFLNRWVLGLLVLLALANFIYAVVRYIAAYENENERAERRAQIFWGIIGLFVILSVWGLVYVISNTFGLDMGGRLEGWND